MNYTADIAFKTGVELIIVGTELTATEKQSINWRRTISMIRERVQQGIQLVYGCNWWPGPNNVNWWDELDYIGVDAYYSLSELEIPSVSNFIEGWKNIAEDLHNISDKFQRPILFPEIGYTSSLKCGFESYKGTSVLNLKCQANAYEGLFEALFTQTWFAGVFFWAYTTNPVDGGKCDNGFCPRLKDAENIIQKYFKGSRELKLQLNETIYSNGHLYWDIWSQQGVVNLKARDKVYKGEMYSLSASMFSQGIVSFHINSISTFPFTRLHFRVLGSTSLTNQLWISVNNYKGDELRSRPAHFYSDNCILSEKHWQAISIPLYDLQAQNISLSQINFKNVQNVQGQFWLTDIYLLA